MEGEDREFKNELLYGDLKLPVNELCPDVGDAVSVTDDALELSLDDDVELSAGDDLELSIEVFATGVKDDLDPSRDDAFDSKFLIKLSVKDDREPSLYDDD